MPSKTWSEIEGVVKMVGHFRKYTTCTSASPNVPLKIGIIVRWRGVNLHHFTLAIIMIVRHFSLCYYYLSDTAVTVSKTCLERPLP